jgi:hypothetical protein
MRNHLSKGRWMASLYHTDMAGELAMLRTTVSSIIEFGLRCLPDETFCVEVVGELIDEFWKLE